MRLWFRILFIFDWDQCHLEYSDMNVYNPIPSWISELGHYMPMLANKTLCQEHEFIIIGYVPACKISQLVACLYPLPKLLVRSYANSGISKAKSQCCSN